MSNVELRKKELEQIKRNKIANYNFAIFLSMLAVAFLLFIFSILLGISLSKKEYIEQVSYSEKSNLSYSVCLNPNEFFEVECLAMDKEYIASLIDKININFLYSFSAAKSLDYNYNYYAEAELIVTERTKQKVIYEKKEKITEDKAFNKKASSGYTINEQIVIDYKGYTEKMKEFKNEYAILSDSKLVVSLYINTEAKYKAIENKIKSNQVMKIEIPLSEQTMDINFSQKDINTNNTIYEEKAIENRKIKTELFYGSISLMSLLIATSILYIRRKMNKHSKFEIELAKIMKEYDRFITTITNLPPFEDKKVLKVATFEDLLDTRECLNKPILYCELKKGEKGFFLIISDDIIYINFIGK